MARRDDKPSSFSEHLQRLVSPQMKRAFAEMARRYQQPQDPPTTTEATPTSAPAATSTPPPEPASPEASTPAPRKPRHGEQRARVERALRTLFPPDGKAPRGLIVKVVKGRVAEVLAAEKKTGIAPEDEKGLPDPSEDVVGTVMGELGRRT